jgi:hypothetical protein
MITLMVALMLWNPCGPIVYTEGRSTSFKSPRVAKSRQRFWSVLGVWLTSKTSGTNFLELIAYGTVGPTKHDIETVHLDKSLTVNWVRES